MNLWILIGIVIIVVGFSLKLDVLAVVLTAGIATGIAAKMNFFEILGIIGKSFVDNRLMSIFLISLPVIAVLERYGLDVYKRQFQYISFIVIADFSYSSIIYFFFSYCQSLFICSILFITYFLYYRIYLSYSIHSSIE